MFFAHRTVSSKCFFKGASPVASRAYHIVKVVRIGWWQVSVSGGLFRRFGFARSLSR